ncbi:MAG: hypothetical protein JST00_30835 [Deltaproteobacteria bacterium]|nr:hypothetical protein [Deltaproteobacteria bacterium]
MRIAITSCALLGLGLVAACGSSGRGRIDDQAPTDPTSSSSSGDNTSSSGGLGTSSGGSSSGTSGETCAAQTTSAQRAEVDIIVVIDTSGSMGEETAQVQANINKFAAKIGSTGLDYTVVMIAEKPKPPPIPIPGFPPLPGICVPAPLAGASCADNPPKFHQIDTDVGSTDSLQIILDQYSTYQAWLRPTAYKVFIEVTDDNSSLAWATFDTQLLAKSSAQFGTATSRRYIFNSICGWSKGTPVLSGTKCGSAVNTGDQYQNLSKLTGGVVDSVCETDYSGVFDNIAKGLVTKLGCEFAFPKETGGKPADPSKVVVKYTPGGGATKPLTQVTDASKCGTIADAWYYDDNTKPTKIVFCPTTCTSAGGDTGGKLEIAVGCQAPPPK